MTRLQVRAPLKTLPQKGLPAALCACLLALPALAQEEPGGDIEIPTAAEVESISTQEERPSRWSAAGWCPLVSSERQDEKPEQSAEEAHDEEGQEGAEGDEKVQCDAGFGAALIGKDFRQGRLSLVGVLGAKTLGFGGAWTFGRQGSHPLSVALGVVAPYDGEGVYVEEWAVALGATVAVFGRR